MLNKYKSKTNNFSEDGDGLLKHKHHFYRVHKMPCITVYRFKILEGVSVFTLFCTKLICSIYLSLCMVITGNYVHSIYSSFVEKLSIILYITFILSIY